MRLRASLAVALLAAAVASVVVLPPSVAQGPAPLPDLDQVAPYQLSTFAERRNGRKRFYLAFGSATQNVGKGRLVIVGRRPSTAVKLMTAEQVIDPPPGSSDPPQVVPNVGVLRYTRSPDHSHWHFLGYTRYELRRASNFRRVGRDRKTGFCIGDRFHVGVFALRDARAAGKFDDECGRGRPRLLEVREGMSPRRGDDYRPRLEGQSIDITRLRTGRYVLVHRTNVFGRIRESNYANNAASVLIWLGRRGNRRPPEVEVIESCTETARCR